MRTSVCVHVCVSKSVRPSVWSGGKRSGIGVVVVVVVVVLMVARMPCGMRSCLSAKRCTLPSRGGYRYVLRGYPRYAFSCQEAEDEDATAKVALVRVTSADGTMTACAMLHRLGTPETKQKEER